MAKKLTEELIVKGKVRELTLDQNGRVVIPADWRKNMGGKVLLAWQDGEHVVLGSRREAGELLRKRMGMMKATTKAKTKEKKRAARANT